VAVSWDKVRATFGSELAVSAQCRGGGCPISLSVPPPTNNQKNRVGGREKLHPTVVVLSMVCQDRSRRGHAH